MNNELIIQLKETGFIPKIHSPENMDFFKNVNGQFRYTEITWYDELVIKQHWSNITLTMLFSGGTVKENEQTFLEKCKLLGYKGQ